MHDGQGSWLRAALRAVQRGQINNAAASERLQDGIDDWRLTIDSMEPVPCDQPLLRVDDSGARQKPQRAH